VRHRREPASGATAVGSRVVAVLSVALALCSTAWLLDVVVSAEPARRAAATPPTHSVPHAGSVVRPTRPARPALTGWRAVLAELDRYRARAYAR
jgi:hypothetical protein